MSVRTWWALIASLATALALARSPVFREVLDERRRGGVAATVFFLWLWGGFTLAATRIRRPSRRLVAYGWVLFGFLALNLLFVPCIIISHPPDDTLANGFRLGALLATPAFWVAGWLLREYEDRAAGRAR